MAKETILASKLRDPFIEVSNLDVGHPTVASASVSDIMLALFHPSITKIRKSLKARYRGKINLKLNKDSKGGYDTKYDIILRKSFLCFKYRKTIGSILFSLTNVTLSYEWKQLDTSMSSLGEHLYYLFREHVQPNINIHMKLGVDYGQINKDIETWSYDFEVCNKVDGMNKLLLDYLYPRNY